MTNSTDAAERPRLSVAMIVRDEEAVLAESIESIRAIADEIVVLDTGSSDQTATLAEQLGAKVGHMAWGFDFAAARNRCRELATGDWILWLDAGERLQGNSASELREFIDQQADSTKVYMLMVEVPSADPGGFGELTVQLRLMPNCPELRFTGRVRETLDTSLESAGLQADAVEMRILRHPRQHEPARKMSRAQRDLELVALETATTSPLPARFLLAEGNAYADLGDFENARNTFRKAIDASEKGSAEMLGGYYGLLAAFDADPFLRDVQLSTSVEALEFFPWWYALLSSELEQLDEILQEPRLFSL